MMKKKQQINSEMAAFCFYDSYNIVSRTRTMAMDVQDLWFQQVYFCNHTSCHFS